MHGIYQGQPQQQPQQPQFVQSRPLIPPRPNANSLQRNISSRLTYPRLSTCDVGFYSGPPASSTPLPPLPSHTASLTAEVTNFNIEASALRTIDQVRSGWADEATARKQRDAARAAAEELRKQRELELEIAAQQKREAEEALRLAAEAARKAAEERAAELARQARLKAEEEEARDRAESEKLKAEEAMLAARKLELERKQLERQQQAAAAAAAYAPPIAHPIGQQHQSVAVSSGSGPTPAQLAYERSFQELTGINNSVQVSTLLSALHYDLDRAIAIFFSEDPPNMLSALEKAKSIQQNAAGHHPQQAPQQPPQPMASSYPPQQAYPSQPSQQASFAAQPTKLNVSLARADLTHTARVDD